MPARRPGLNMGMFTVPPVGSGVWIEFERGDPATPSGWVVTATEGDPPSLVPRRPPAWRGITLQTTLGNGLVINDSPAAAS